MKQKITSVIFSVAALLLIITISIGLPIYFRPFYYAHITPMKLEETSGFTKEEIIDAYNEVLDYLTLPGKEFGTGVMRYSDSGKDHFVDCKGLFDLNALILLTSAAVLTVLTVLRRKGKIPICDLGGFHPIFYSGLGAILIPSFLGLVISADFDRAFVVFHKIFFPGKDNWTFDSRYDEIINVLPQDFFRNCAILIALGIIVLGSVVMIWSIVRRRRKIKN